MSLPSLFIGSSSEGLALARQLQLELERDAEGTIWTQGVFSPMGNTLDSLVTAARAADFAVLVLTPDDMLTKREHQTQGPRDNVLLELGLFMGILGKDRAFMVYCRDERIELPTDLAGVTAVTFGRRADGNLQAALGPACTKIGTAMRTLGRRSEARIEEQTLVSLLVLCYVNDQELGHLRRLDAQAPYPYERTALLQGELRRLRRLGLLHNVSNHTVAKMPAGGDLRQHLAITNEGQKYLAMRSQLERDGSLIALSEQRLKKAKPWI
jgi:hypothetical protein